MFSINKKESVQKIVDLYDNDHFMPIRFWDAPFLEVERLIPKKGTLMDLGCGEGIFTNFLALSASNRKLIGIEIDSTRIKKADKHLKNVSFKKGNIVTCIFPKFEHAILFNVLHHLTSQDDQEKVIEKVISKLEKGSKIFIIEVDKNYSLKYFLSWFVDYFIVAWVFDKKLISEKIIFRSSKKWTNLLKSKKLKIQKIDLSHNKPFAHFLLIGTKI